MLALQSVIIPGSPPNLLLGYGGKGFAIIASDTRLSQGYSILSRNTSKLCEINENVMLGTIGCYADNIALKKRIQVQMKHYEFEQERTMPASACASMLSKILYSKRFFPYYCFNLLAGIDENGQGWCWNYDAIGSFKPSRFSQVGTGSSLIAPVLDQQFVGYNTTGEQKERSIEEVQDIIIDCFNCAAERDMFTG